MNTLLSKLSTLSVANKLEPNRKRLLIGAYGFEARSLGWSIFQSKQGKILSDALIFRYLPSKGKNRIKDLQEAVKQIGVEEPSEVVFDFYKQYNIEKKLEIALDPLLLKVEEVVIDISAMTKLLILACLCKLKKFTGDIRIVYSEAEKYSPSEEEYKKSKSDMSLMAKFPSQGVESIVRLKCLSSIRMQGQPAILVAFTSFNEQLVRHMLGTINPHRLLFINGHPPRKEFAWREKATQEIQNNLINEYKADNPINEEGLLKKAVSTLKYIETINQFSKVYKRFGSLERLICAATGSKMQTVGLYFCKMMYPDIHIEYPTPDSYFVKGYSEDVRAVHEIFIPNFSKYLAEIKGIAFRNYLS